MDPLLVRLGREPEPGFKLCNLLIVLEACLPQLWTMPRLALHYVWRRRQSGLHVNKVPDRENGTHRDQERTGPSPLGFPETLAYKPKAYATR